MGRSVVGIESTAHTFSVAVASREGKILSDVREVYSPPEGSGIHPYLASQCHAKAAPRVLRDALVTSGVGVPTSAMVIGRMD